MCKITIKKICIHIAIGTVETKAIRTIIDPQISTLVLISSISEHDTKRLAMYRLVKL